MTVLVVIVWAIVGMAAGLAIGGEIAPAFGYRNMEGMAGIFAVVFVAPIGALAGGVFGFTMARKYPTRRGSFLGYSVAAIALAVFAGVAFELLTNDRLAQRATLMFEVRLPPGMPLPQWREISGHLRTKGEDGSRISSYGYTGFERVGDTTVIQGHVDVYREAADRVVTFRIGKDPLHLFRINAPAKPVETKTMGPWLQTDLIEEDATRRKPKGGEAFEFRYRFYY